MNIPGLATFSILLFKLAIAASWSVIGTESHAAQSPVLYKSETDSQNAISRISRLKTDYVNTDSRNKNKLASLFNPLYVVKGPATDCSFVSAFMLMVNHDPDYPYKILTSDGNSYSIKYPGLDESINLSEEELKRYYSQIESMKATGYKSEKGYTPEGVEILRAAYYDYQRKKWLRPPQYKVYGGGQPIQDLMILSGIENGGKIVAVQGYTEISHEWISFANGLEQKIKVRQTNGLFVFKNDGYSDEIEEPFSVLDDDLSSYLISVSSVRRIGFMDNLFGKRIIANHAYYFLGTDSDGNYILGDSYNTRNPVHIDKQEFLEKFNAINYVKITAD